MKRSHKKQYESAMGSRIKKLCETAGEPVVVDAYRLLDRACDIEGIPHTLGPDDSAFIIRTFGGGVESYCDSIGCSAIPIPSPVLEIVGHAKQAQVDDEECTPRHYHNATQAKRGVAPFVGWALFGPLTDAGHPIATSTRAHRIQPIVSAAENCTAETKKMIEKGQLAADDLERLSGELHRIANHAGTAVIEYKES